MRRLASAFVTWWLLIGLPSLVIWGLFVRSGDRGTERFAAVWHWSADRLAFPLLLSPLTDWSWQALETGSRLPATAGFVVLVAVWTTMLVLPLVMIYGWWCWLQRRLSSTPSSYASAYGDEATAPYQSIPSRTSASPLAALYVFTLPIALVWNGLLAVARPFRRSETKTSSSKHPILAFVWPILLCAAVAFVGQIVYFHLFFTIDPSGYRDDTVRALTANDWYGYLDVVRIPRIRDDDFQDNARIIARNYRRLNPGEWEHYAINWIRFSEVWFVVLVTAARQAMLVGAIATGVQLLRKVF